MAKDYSSASIRRMRHALRLRGPLAQDPTAQMLHFLLLAVAVWMALLATISFKLFPPITLPRLFLPVLLEASLVSALILLRLGHFRAASLVYLGGTWLWATLTSAYPGIRSTTLMLYSTLPVSAAWLLGYRAALWTAGYCIGAMLVLAFLEMVGMAPPRAIPGTPLGMWATAVQATLIGTIPVGQVIKRLRATLEELQGYKQHLERLVELRTNELVQARDQAQAANRSKSAFLANMNHELRTPLNSILGFSRMVMQDVELPEKHRENLAIVGRSGEHLLELIDEVLDLAKIETGGTAVENLSMDLHGLVNETVDLLRDRAKTKNLGLLVNISSRAPEFVRSDPRKFRQVLINLVGNALKYTDEGRVIVKLDARPRDVASEVMLIFDVEDTGIGISSEDQARIFDPFVQANDARKGTGLGLSISRRFVELMGGTIEVESAPGRGSRFHVELPAQISAGTMVKTNPVSQVIGIEPGQPDYRILIVEDEQDSGLLLQRMLGAVGFQTDIADNGARAVEIFKQWRPHFIWMDLRIPVMSGLEATRRIRGLEGGKEVKIVTLTASAFESQREEVLAAGCDDFLRKPYRSSEIFDCLARHLGVRYLSNVMPEPALQNPVTLHPEDLAELPVAKLKELERVVNSLDPGRIALVVAQVAEQHPAVGATLQQFTEKLAYSPILRAIQSYRRLTETKAD